MKSKLHRAPVVVEAVADIASHIRAKMFNTNILSRDLRVEPRRYAVPIEFNRIDREESSRAGSMIPFDAFPCVPG